ncbi:MAG TPA: SRPBCC domain-containing protein [Myxococcaceae bacterium]|nr:SRPBCC domain-containing protein [Myxococcaceae bacterium]
MASDWFEIQTVIPAAPEDVYRAWLDGKEHGRMTGGPARGEPVVGAEHGAWDGYIRGRNLELEPGVRIVQSWRTTEFPEGAPDSRLEVLLRAAPAGTRLVLRHSEIPEGQGASYEEGWVEHYFEPMEKYFGKKAPAKKKAAPKKRKATASSRKAAARGGGRRKKASRPRRR